MGHLKNDIAIVSAISTVTTCLIVCMFIHYFISLMQQLTKRQLKRSRSLISMLLWGEPEEDDLGKAKNIRQTELLVDLREAILQIARHFQSIDPKNNKLVSFFYTAKELPLLLSFQGLTDTGKWQDFCWLELGGQE